MKPKDQVASRGYLKKKNKPTKGIKTNTVIKKML